MDTTAHYRKLENMYIQAPINQQLFDSTTAKISDGQATIQLELKKDYFHALGALHGSVYFKLLDDAAFFSVQSQVRDYFVLTTSFTIDFMRPVTAGKITAKGSVRFRSRRSFIATSVLLDEAGREIGMGVGRFVKSKTALTPEIGYA